VKIVFMGTPDFAAESLKRLYDGGWDVIAVFTQPDRPSGRGMKLTPPPVKAAAMGKSPVYQPDTLRGGEAEAVLRDLAPDIIVVVAYGRLLPPEILALPRLGCVNIHASLLPRYRGAAPIQRAVLNGETVTGVTSMYMAPELDAGDIILAKSAEVGESETSGELFARLAPLGAELLSETLDLIERGKAPRTPQNHAEASFAPPLTKELSPIDWHMPPGKILNQIRALNPWPVAKTTLRGIDYKIFSAKAGAGVPSALPGEIVSAGKDGIEVACSGGSVIVTELAAANGKRMPAAEYLRGHPVKGQAGAPYAPPV
jgi:methionyl-tRNA formyltransferase